MTKSARDSKITLAQAKEAVEAIAAAAEHRPVAVVIAVSDHQGELILLERLDDAPLASIRIAANKAWTAARERKPSGDIGRAARDPKTGFDISYYGDSRYTGWGGGLPVQRNGSFLGAIAVSGADEDTDVELSSIGAAILSASTGGTGK